MYTKIVLCLVALPLLASCRPTHCERHKGDSQFRCAKDNYKADSVRVVNIADTHISFKISKWVGRDENPTKIKFSEQSHSLESGGHVDVAFSEALKGIYNELYVFDCKKIDVAVDCLYAVTAYPYVSVSSVNAIDIRGDWY